MARTVRSIVPSSKFYTGKLKAELLRGQDGKQRSGFIVEPRNQRAKQKRNAFLIGHTEI